MSDSVSRYELDRVRRLVTTVRTLIAAVSDLVAVTSRHPYRDLVCAVYRRLER